MNALFGFLLNNKKRIVTLVLAYILYSLSTIDGYGFLYGLTYLVVNSFICIVAAKVLMRTAVSATTFKGKKFRLFVMEDKQKTESE